MSTVATVGAAAWVVPEILTAKPAAGATLSVPVVVANPVATSASTTPTTTAAATQPHALAFTGLNLQRDTEIGAALIAGGWALQHWASRTPTEGGTGPPQARSAGDSA
jgi:hypothetical protein